MPLDCTICTETFGNGVRTIITLIIKAHPLMGVLGLARTNLLQKYCGAVPGAAILMAAVPRFASTFTAATSAASITVFGSSAYSGGLCNPFSLFSLFTLVRFFWANVLYVYYKGIERMISLLSKWVEILISPSLKRRKFVKIFKTDRRDHKREVSLRTT